MRAIGRLRTAITNGSRTCFPCGVRSMGDRQFVHGIISMCEGGGRPVVAIANRVRSRARGQAGETSTEAAWSARAENIVKSGGNLVEENVRRTTSFKTIAGFPDMKL